MSSGEVLAARDDVVAALTRLRALDTTADGQVLIDALKFDQLNRRRLRYDTTHKPAQLDRDGELTARGVRAAVFPTTPNGQPVEPKLPATAAALATGEIDTAHAEAQGGQRPHVLITLDYQQLLRLATGATLDLGGRVGAGEPRRLLCDARIVPVVLGANRKPLDVERARRARTRP